MNDTLLRAILAMDAYNRGYNSGISAVGNQIGSATVYKDALDESLLPAGAAQAIGFYAAAYQLADGSIVISYRGTDEYLLDPLNGYGVAIGSTDGAPGQSGFAELQGLDVNADGVIDAADTSATAGHDFDDLRVWQDLNRDGRRRGDKGAHA